MDSSDREEQESQTQDQPIFGLCHAYVLSPPAGEYGHEKGRHIPKSPKPIVHLLHGALLSAQSEIQKLRCENKSLKEENSSLAVKGLNISESLEELKRLHSEKEEMRVQMKEMEEDFQRQMKALQDLNGEKMEEILVLRTQVLASQSRDIQTQEEVRKREEMWQKRVQQLEEEVKESEKLLSEGRTQVEKQILSLEETVRLLKEERTASLSAKDAHCNEVIQLIEDNAATKLRECEDRWKIRVQQLEEEVKESEKELSEVRTQIEKQILSLEETVRLLKEEKTARISTIEDHYQVLIQAKQEEAATKLRECDDRLHIQKQEHAAQLSAKDAHHQEVISLAEEDSATKLRECEESWRIRVQQLEEEVKESEKELSEGRAQVEKQILSLEETVRLLKEERTASLSAKDAHCNEVIQLIEDNAATKLRECEDRWKIRVQQLEDELEKSRKEPSEGWAQVEKHTVSIEETVRLLKEESAARISTIEDHYQALIQAKQEEAATKLRECEDRLKEERIASLSAKDAHCNKVIQLIEDNAATKLREFDDRLHIQKREHAAQLSAKDAHHQEVISLAEEDSATKLSECEERWRIRVQQLEEEVKEYTEDLFKGRTQVEKQILSLEETISLLKEEGVARISTLEDHYQALIQAQQEEAATKLRECENRLKEERTASLSAKDAHFNEVIQLIEDNAATKLRECEDRWKIRVQQLEDELEKSRKEPSEGWAQVEKHTVSIEETVRLLKEESAARISTIEDHYQVLIQAKQEEAATKLRECEERWQIRVRQLEEERQMFRRDLIQSMAQRETQENARAELRESEERWRVKVEQLEEELEVSKRGLGESRTQAESPSSSVEEVLRDQPHSSAAECSDPECHCTKKEDELRALKTSVEKLEGELKNQKGLVSHLFDTVTETTAGSRNPKKQNKSGAKPKSRKEHAAQDDSWKRRLMTVKRKETPSDGAVDPEDNDLAGLISSKQKTEPWWKRSFKITRPTTDDASAAAEYTRMEE